MRLEKKVNEWFKKIKNTRFVGVEEVIEWKVKTKCCKKFGIGIYRLVLWIYRSTHKNEHFGTIKN